MDKNRSLIKLYLFWKYAIVIHKPFYMLRFLEMVAKGYLFNRTSLRGIDFATTYECNMHCQHCFTENLKRDSRAVKLTLADYRRIASEAMELGCTYFGFQGGEFFLDSGYRDIIAAVRPSANRIAITTNGYLLNQGIIQELKKLGVDLINFSLDSSIPEEHDAFRGIKGSYARVMEAIKMSRRLGMNVTINATVCHDNLYTKGLRDLMEFSHAHKILLNTLFAAPVGHWEANLNALLNKDDVAYYNALRVKYPFMVRDMDSGFKGSGCPALKEVLYITPYGDVLGCPFIHISLGNLKKEPLGAIRRRALSMENLDFYQRYNPVCLIAEDEDFIKKYLKSVKNNDDAVLDYQKATF